MATMEAYVPLGTGLTHDFWAFNSSGQVWNGAAFIAYTVGDFSTSYRIAATEASGTFTATAPTGTVTYQLRLRGATLADSYVVAGPGEFTSVSPVTPLASTVDPGAVTDSPLTIYQYESISLFFTITDANGDAVDLTGKTVKFIARSQSGVGLWELDGTVGGDDSNEVTVTADNTNTQVRKTIRYVLWNATDDRVLARGPLKIAQEADSTLPAED